MFNLFKKQQTTVEPQRTMKEIIEEIHETFYTEVDRLLAEAKITLSTHTDKVFLLEKTKRLRDLGFVKSQEVQEGSKEENRLKEINKINTIKKDVAEAIEYFSFKYPNYKFITEESVKKICEKYNLIYGPVSLYVGSIPDKNMQHIENFNIHEADRAAAIFTERTNIMDGRLNVTQNRLMSTQEMKKQESMENSLYHDMFRRTVYRSLPLEIAAPKKDFDTSGMVLSERQLIREEILDPVVLQPIFWRGVKHYLIVTAWGDEASDELVVNENMN